MIKKTALALAAVAAGVSAQAQEASALSVTVDVTYVSDYVFRGVQLGDASVQPSIEASYGDFYAGVWHTSELSSNDGTTETDLYAGYGFAVTDIVSLDVGVTQYTYSGGSGGDSTEVFVGVAADVLLSPSLYVYHDFDYDTYTIEASVGYSIPVDAINTSIDLSASVGYQTSDDNYSSGGVDLGLDDYTYYTVGASIPYALSDTATLTVGVEYIYNTEDAVTGFSGHNNNDAVVGSAGISIGF